MLDLVSLDYRSPDALETSTHRIDALAVAHSLQKNTLQVMVVPAGACSTHLT